MKDGCLNNNSFGDNGATVYANLAPESQSTVVSVNANPGKRMLCHQNYVKYSGGENRWVNVNANMRQIQKT